MLHLKLTSIQILRGIAAVWVVLAHATGFAEATGAVNGVLKFVSGYGWAGVDIFFVLSGFVIYYAVYGKKITAGQFFARRLERIVPPTFC